MDKLFCFVCKQNYDFINRIPRLIPSCGHTICSTCAFQILRTQDQIKCPQDNIEFFIQHRQLGIENFPINFSMMQKLQKQQQPPIRRRSSIKLTLEFDFKRNCTQHKKVYDLVCLTDYQFICADCILFGEHKNHDFQKVRHLQQDAIKRSKQLSEQLQEEKMQQQNFDKDFLIRKKNEYKNKIVQSFKDIKNYINELERELSNKIDSQFDMLEQKQSLIVQKYQEIDSQIKKIQSQTDKIQQDLNLNQVNNEELLDKLFRKNNFIDQLNSIQQEKTILQSQLNNDIKTRANKIKLNIDTDMVKLNLKQYINIKQNEDLDETKIQLQESSSDRCSINLDIERDQVQNQSDYDDHEEENLIDNISIDDDEHQNPKPIKNFNYFHSRQNSATSLNKHQSQNSFVRLNSYQTQIRPTIVNSIYNQSVDKSGEYFSKYQNKISTQNNKRFTQRNTVLEKSLKNKHSQLSINSRRQTKMVDKWIRLNKQAIKDDTISQIEQSIKKNPRVKKLDLSENYITTKGFKKVMKIISKFQITDIDFCGNLIDKQAFNFLQLFQNNKNQRLKINLMNNKIRQSKKDEKNKIHQLQSKGIVVCL